MNAEILEFPNETTTYKEVTVSITLSKSLCLEIPDNFNKEQIIDQAKREIITPDKIIKISEQFFKQNNIKIQGVDFKDWNVDELEYIVE